MSEVETHQYKFNLEQSQRLDAYLASLHSDRSRSSIAKLIKEGSVLVDGKKAKPSLQLKTGWQIEITFPPEPSNEPMAEKIDLDVLYEDEHILVVDKPAGMVVHPGCGHKDGTLVNALLYNADTLSEIDDPQRMGIVHRLDKDTSGVILTAKTNRAHLHIAAQFKDRQVEKEYIALTDGVPQPLEGVVDLPLGRSKRDRKKMAGDREKGKVAQTRYEVRKNWGKYSLVHCFPKTGRTHQIRVHLLSLKTPILCDPIYGKQKEIKEVHLGGQGGEVALGRLALHAHRLKVSLFGQELEFKSPMPQDLCRAVKFFDQYLS